MEMLLIKNGNVFSPEPLGKKDILVGGGIILAIEDKINPSAFPGQIEQIDALGCNVVPGFIDGHQHFTGGGGEGGFHTRTPEMTLSQNIENGVTTAVGLLGTDAITRSVENLFAKAMAFNAEGITAYMLTGSYWLPSPSICGSAAKDLAFIDPVIGVKLAMADQRGPNFDAKDLAALASDVRVAALVSNKPGTITVHTGVNEDCLDKIFEVVEHHFIRPDIFIPTHINRKEEKLYSQSFKLARMGAFIDATCCKEDEDEGSSYLTAAHVANDAAKDELLHRICFSSDAGGSLPKWDESRSRIVGMSVGTPNTLLIELRRLIQVYGFDLEHALMPLTTNPAKVYGLAGKKGQVSVGSHADILVLSAQEIEICDVVAKGKVMMKDRHLIKKGYFE